MSWSEFYKDRAGNESYRAYFEKKYNPYLAHIVYGLSHGLTVREAGCGTGLVTEIISCKSDWFVTWAAFDNDPEMLEMAWPLWDVIVEIGDMWSGRCHVDIEHSHGVLEHYQDDQIHALLHIQKQYAYKVIHYVPTDGYDEPSFGDERLLPIEYWVDTFKPDYHFDFNQGKDLVLSWCS